MDSESARLVLLGKFKRPLQAGKRTGGRQIGNWWAENKETGCWEWIGATVLSGSGERYGKFHEPVTRKTCLAHRFIFEMVVGKISKGMVIDHICRNTICVNPQHLRETTQSQNVIHGNDSRK